MQVTSSIGLPLIPPSSELTQSAAASIATRASGKEPAGEFSIFIRPTKTGSRSKSAFTATTGN